MTVVYDLKKALEPITLEYEAAVHARAAHFNAVINEVFTTYKRASKAHKNVGNFGQMLVDTLEDEKLRISVEELGWQNHQRVERSSVNISACTAMDVILNSAISVYKSAPIREAKSFFTEVARELANRIVGEKIDIKATEAPRLKLYKKEGRHFASCNDFGTFEINDVRYGPRDGIILQMSKSGTFYELTAHTAPTGVGASGETLAVNKGFIRTSLAQALLKASNKDAMSKLITAVEDMFSADPTLATTGSLKTKPVEEKESSLADIRKEIPGFGMWG